jgi:uncharacterized protein YcbX
LSLRVSALYIYPVKACAAIALESAEVEPLGLAGDRRFALMSDDGVAITQRDCPLLATVRPRLDGGLLQLDLGGLAAIAVDQFIVPVSVEVWGKSVPGLAAPERATALLAEYVGARLRIVRLHPAAERSFADSRPVLVTTSRMLAALNSKLEKPVDLERFRPNIVLDGEIDGQPLRSREVTFEYEKPCERCEVTTIDQSSGQRRGPEPLATLTERFGGQFGLYYRVARPGRLRRGEQVDQTLD